MAVYTVVPDTSLGFGVEILAPDRRLYIRGFATEGDARIWVTEQQIAEDVIAEAQGVARTTASSAAAC
jgi:hypothetical protein